MLFRELRYPTALLLAQSKGIFAGEQEDIGHTGNLAEKKIYFGNI